MMEKKFYEAIMYSEVERIKLLINNGSVDPSSEDNRGLLIAVRRGRLDVVRLLLLDKRVDPSTDSNRALNEAIRRQDLEMTVVLLRDHRVRKVYKRRIYHRDECNEYNCITWAIAVVKKEIVTTRLVLRRVLNEDLSKEVFRYLF